MRPLRRPTLASQYVYENCAARIADDNERNALLGQTNEIVARTIVYANLCAIGEEYTIAPHIEVNGVPRSSFMKLYDNHLSRKLSPAREMYDAIRIGANGLCPYCAHRPVSSLDHYLSKSRYISLVVAPDNLVPSCSDCNKSKLDGLATIYEEQPFHPYFDDWAEVAWLQSIVIEQTPCAFDFNVSTATFVNPLDGLRMQNHFEAFGLRALYMFQAASEFSGIKTNLETHFDIGGRALLHNEINSRRDSYSRNNRNSWQAAMYAAMGQSDWFLEGNFRLQ